MSLLSQNYEKHGKRQNLSSVFYITRAKKLFLNVIDDVPTRVFSYDLFQQNGFCIFSEPDSKKQEITI